MCFNLPPCGQRRAPAVFSADERFVLWTEDSGGICAWNSISGKLSGHINAAAGGGGSPVTCVAASPTGSCFVSCYNDFKARIWSPLGPAGNLVR